jgi:hypothetical protein
VVAVETYIIGIAKDSLITGIKKQKLELNSYLLVRIEINPEKSAKKTSFYQN